MTSPDFREYVDLTIYDTTPQALYDEAVTYAQTALPEFEPRIGTIEDALLQSMAYVGGVLATGINRLPNGIMEGMCRLLGFNRLEAEFATGEVTFTTSVNTGTVIPKGTVVTYDTYNDGITTSYPFSTDSDLIIPSESDSGNVTVTATVASKYPALLAGQSLTLVSQVPYVIATEMYDDLSVGADSESPTAFFTRAAQYFASLNATIATASQMSNYIVSNYSTVPVVKVYDLTDSSLMLFSEADAPGKVTVCVCNTNGDALTSTVKTELGDDLSDRCVAGLTISVIDMDEFDVAVNIAISVLDGFAPAEVSAAVTAVIDSYLSHTGWDFQETINKNILIAKASQISGVKYVSSLNMVLNVNAAGKADEEEVGGSPTGNITMLKKGVIPIGAADVSVI
jgi:Baseplate J-like protein